MNLFSFARAFGAALLVVALAPLTGCSSDEPTLTTEQIQQNNVLGDNDIFSALVAGNYNTSQVANGASGLLTAGDGGSGDFANQEISDSNAALVRLYGTSDVNPADGSTATLGGLGASAGLTPVSNWVTDMLNTQATADAATLGASTTPDYDYANVALASNQALLDLCNFALNPTDGGANVTNSALVAELNTEAATFSTNINTATGLQAQLAPPPATTP